MKFNILHHIASIRQPEENDCWATGAAMIMKRHSLRGVTHVKNLTKRAGVQLKNDGSLPINSVQKFARAIKKRCMAISGGQLCMHRLHKALIYGPVMMLGKVKIHGPTGHSEIKHALVINGLKGKTSTSTNTYVYYTDPQTGFATNVSYEFFLSDIIDRVDFVIF